MSAFPAAFEPESVINVEAPIIASVPADGAVGLPALPSHSVARPKATAFALEGALNRTRPLTLFQQASDRRPRQHGIHPLVVQPPMVDKAATHAAMAVIFTATTRGDARGLWPTLAKGLSRDLGGASAGPVILSAPQATEAAIVEVLQLVLSGPGYTNLAGAAAAPPPPPAGPPAAGLASAAGNVTSVLANIAEVSTGNGSSGNGGSGGEGGGGAAAAAADARRPAVQVFARAASMRAKSGIPDLSQSVQADLQVSRLGWLQQKHLTPTLNPTTNPQSQPSPTTLQTSNLPKPPNSPCSKTSSTARSQSASAPAPPSPARRPAATTCASGPSPPPPPRLPPAPAASSVPRATSSHPAAAPAASSARASPTEG
jgi:hypothetical protein